MHRLMAASNGRWIVDMATIETMVRESRAGRVAFGNPAAAFSLVRTAVIVPSAGLLSELESEAETMLAGHLLHFAKAVGGPCKLVVRDSLQPSGDCSKASKAFHVLTLNLSEYC